MSKLLFLRENLYICPRTTQRFLVASEGFSSGVEMFGSFLCTASTVVTQFRVMKHLAFHSKSDKCPQKKTSKKLQQLEFKK